jgi:type II secretory pathway component PulF
MIEGGADVLSGLGQAESAISSPEIGSRLGSARRDVREGADLGEAFSRREVLPPMITAVVRSGMAGGELGGALRRASRLCIERQEMVTERLLTLMEPAVIVILAGAVGWVVYSLVTGMLAITNVDAF